MAKSMQEYFNGGDDSESDCEDQFDKETFGTTLAIDNNVLICSYCNTIDNSIEREGFHVCKKCGVPTEIVIDQNAEWNNYSENNIDKSRCGYVDTSVFKTSTLSTCISGNSKLSKMSKWGSMTHKDADLYKVKQIYERLADRNGFPKSIVEDTSMIYQKVVEKATVRQAVREGIKAAAFYQALNKHSKCYNIADVARWFNLEPCIVSAGNNFILGLNRKDGSIGVETIRIIKASEIVEKFANHLQMSRDEKRKAKEICEKVENTKHFYGIRGTSLAAGIVFYVLCTSVLSTVVTTSPPAQVQSCNSLSTVERNPRVVIDVAEVERKTKVSGGTIKKVFSTLKGIYA
jgi:transcription initiation factor TFIIIB Brf1 subunit/transcription initiation factor TFIIB